MSAGAQVAVLGARRVELEAAQRRAARGRPALTLAAFAVLGVYGALRWATMLSPEPLGRLFALVAVAVAIAALGIPAQSRDRRVRIAAIIAIAVAVIATFPLAGYPLEWVRHLRIAVQARAIGDGLAALPRVVVPYRGHRDSTASVLVLGAAMLLLGGALTLASSRRPYGEARLAGASLPMVVLAIVPSSLARPQFTYVHGVVLFALLAALIFSERVPARRGAVAALTLGLIALLAATLAPRLYRPGAWLNVDVIVTRVVKVPAGERFDWRQTYGPLNWPHQGQVVMTIGASRYADYWKAEDLDVFDGQGWVANPPGSTAAQREQQALDATVSATTRRHFTQTLRVTLVGMSTGNVIGAGVSAPPPGVPGVDPGGGYGTYVAKPPLRIGTSYAIDVYTPQPAPVQLLGAGAPAPATGLVAERTITIPHGHSRLELLFSRYGSPAPLERYAGISAGQALAALQSSAYGRVYRLARRLERSTGTEYQFVEAVLSYLASDRFHYNTNVAPTPLPLVRFLFDTRRGYCQQFAGAMALLLRMGGVPAHVSAGFGTGSYDPARRAYVVQDIDAHTWVEAWFNEFGWVRFDPTRAANPKLFQLQAPQLGTKGKVGTAGGHGVTNGVHGLHAPGSIPGLRHAGQTARRPGGSSTSAVLPVLAVLALAGVGVALVVRRRRAPHDEDPVVGELERAFARCGRPLPAGITLAALEHRHRHEPAVAEYIRALRLERYAPGAAAANAPQRRALRRALASGLGPAGALRALVALPPRRRHS